VAGGHDHSSGTHAAPSGSDPLSEVLRTVRLTGALFFLVDGSAAWAADVPEASAFAPLILPGAQRIVSYHIVTAGACWAEAPGEPAVRLEAGDVLLVPHGDAYGISVRRRGRGPRAHAEALDFFRAMAAGDMSSVVSDRPGGERFRLVCGFLGCDVRPFNPVVAALPRLVHLPAARADHDRLRHLIDFAVAETRERRSGGQCVLLRLSELMFVEVLRRYLTGLPAEQTGWLAGVRDPVVGHALSLLHGRPAHPWTLEALARDVGVSRSVMAERFVHYVGQPPMHYLARWRMQLAARQLADGVAKVSAVALDVGYDSESAFSRAFKKMVGEPPAAWRKGAAARRLAGG
jgi:AraC-like DNA-binding protein